MEHLIHVFRRYLILYIVLLFLQLPLWGDDPASLQVRIKEGDGQTYPVGSRATRGITVEVTDETGNPVEGAAVSFALPETGPTGEFATGSKTEIVTTHADGTASAWGMHWNRQAGAFDVRITVSKGAARAGTVCSQHLAETTASNPSVGGSSHKWLWITLAVVAVGAGVGIGEAMKGGSSTNCSSTVVSSQNPCASAADPLGVTVIGAPTINLGQP
jgi:hypothetical protein